MRITSLVLGVALGLAMIVYGLWLSSDMSFTQEAQDAGAVLVTAGVFMVVGAAFAYRVPIVTLVMALLTASLSLLAAPHDVPDAYIFAGCAAIVAFLSILANRERHEEEEDRRKQKEQGNRLDALLQGDAQD